MAKPNSFLLDTHIWLWMNGAPERLSERVRSLLADPSTELFLSAVSAWEVSIKSALGKLTLPLPVGRYLEERTRALRVRELPIRREHAVEAGSLPAHHRDPFDRMLIAQATVESIPLITADRQLDRYDVSLLWADAES